MVADGVHHGSGGRGTKQVRQARPELKGVELPRVVAIEALSATATTHVAHT